MECEDDRKARIFTLFSRHVSSGRPTSSGAWASTSSSARDRGRLRMGCDRLEEAHQLPLQRRRLQPRPCESENHCGPQREPREARHRNHHLVSEQRALLAHRLSELTPGDISCTVFGVGGGEAIDLAIKLARGYTGRSKNHLRQGGYHAIQASPLLRATSSIEYPSESSRPGSCRSRSTTSPALLRRSMKIRQP